MDIVEVERALTETRQTLAELPPVPIVTPEVTISMLWHPRFDADPAQRWLRACVREICASLR